MKIEHVSVIGLGYIGLPTAAILASQGVKVTGVDINQDAIDTINEGKVHIVEPDLDMVVHSAVMTERLVATNMPFPADVFMIAVPTPFSEGHKPDLSYVEQAVKNIAPVIEKGNLIILESTSPVGTTEKISRWLAESRPDLSYPHENSENADVNIAHCPERVLPGHVLRELVENDRIIGGMSSRCSEQAIELYKIFVKGECIITNAKTAELAKLVENSFRDVNIAFANELSLICDEQNIDVWELIALANRHPRVNILTPGPGVGGHCIAVDPWFIVDSAPESAKLIKTARLVNDYKPEFVLKQIQQAADKFKKPKICCLGLAFKPDIDDLRESPALYIANQLINTTSAEVTVCEPNIEKLPAAMADKTRLVSVTEGIHEADIIVILVKHSAFAGITLSDVAEKILINSCGLNIAQ